jgi:hypothetical protein
MERVYSLLLNTLKSMAVHVNMAKAKISADMLTPAGMAHCSNMNMPAKAIEALWVK